MSFIFPSFFSHLWTTSWHWRCGIYILEINSYNSAGNGSSICLDHKKETWHYWQPYMAHSDFTPHWHFRFLLYRKQRSCSKDHLQDSKDSRRNWVSGLNWRPTFHASTTTPWSLGILAVADGSWSPNIWKATHFYPPSWSMWCVPRTWWYEGEWRNGFHWNILYLKWLKTFSVVPVVLTKPVHVHIHHLTATSCGNALKGF